MKSLLITFIAMSIAGKHSINFFHQKEDFLGTFLAYKWVDEDVTEGTYKFANTYLGKEISISRGKFNFFDSCTVSPTYIEKEYNSNNFFEQNYNVDFKKLGITQKTLRVIEVRNKNDAFINYIIIYKNHLIINFKGFFYYFEKDNIPPSPA